MMQIVNINYLAVLVAAIVGFFVGYLWYSNALFGKMWRDLMGFDEKKMKQAMKKGMGKTMTIGFLSTLLMSYILAHFISYVQAQTAIDGILAGLWIWIGFVATIMIGMVMYEGKPMKLYCINSLYWLVTLCVMGAILAVWH